MGYDPLGDGRHTPPNIAAHGYLLGLIGGIGLTLFLSTYLTRPLFALAAAVSSLSTSYTTQVALYGLYLFVLSLFHVSEYILQAMFHPDHIDLSGFMLDHSREYHFAFVAATLDTFLLPRWLHPLLGGGTFASAALALSATSCLLVGLLFRWTAMCTAKQHFTHQIAERKRDCHQLVTSGIYRFFRHPSYLGFTLFSLGTQLLLGNLISLIAYYVVLHRFFKERIAYEERTLRRFFKEEWEQYQQRVRFSGLL